MHKIQMCAYFPYLQLAQKPDYHIAELHVQCNVHSLAIGYAGNRKEIVNLYEFCEVHKYCPHYFSHRNQYLVNWYMCSPVCTYKSNHISQTLQICHFVLIRQANIYTEYLFLLHVLAHTAHLSKYSFYIHFSSHSFTHESLLLCYTNLSYLLCHRNIYNAKSLELIYSDLYMWLLGSYSRGLHLYIVQVCAFHWLFKWIVTYIPLRLDSYQLKYHSA